MLGKLLRAFTVLAVCACVCAAIAGAVYKAGENKQKARSATDAQLKQQEHDAVIAAQQQGIDQIVWAWLSQQPQKSIQYREIIKEVPAYVQINPVCDLTRGAVSVLNTSADPNRLQEAFHPPLTEDASQAPSTVTQRAAVKHCAEVSVQYNELADFVRTLQGAVDEAGLWADY